MLFLSGSPSEPIPTNFTFLSSSTGDEINIHKLDLASNNSAILSIIKPFGDLYSFDVYLKYNDYPSRTNYDWKGQIPNPNVTDITDEFRYVVFPPQNMTQYNGTYRFGISLSGMKLQIF